MQIVHVYYIYVVYVLYVLRMRVLYACCVCVLHMCAAVLWWKYVSMYVDWTSVIFYQIKQQTERTCMLYVCYVCVMCMLYVLCMCYMCCVCVLRMRVAYACCICALLCYDENMFRNILIERQLYVIKQNSKQNVRVCYMRVVCVLCVLCICYMCCVCVLRMRVAYVRCCVMMKMYFEICWLNVRDDTQTKQNAKRTCVYYAYCICVLRVCMLRICVACMCCICALNKNMFSKYVDWTSTMTHKQNKMQNVRVCIMRVAYVLRVCVAYVCCVYVLHLCVE